TQSVSQSVSHTATQLTSLITFLSDVFRSSLLDMGSVTWAGMACKHTHTHTHTHTHVRESQYVSPITYYNQGAIKLSLGVLNLHQVFKIGRAHVCTPVT